MKKSKPPHIPIRPHSYTPDPTDPGDWRGERRCAGCSMPTGSRVHDYRPSAEVSEVERRRIGDGD